MTEAFRGGWCNEHRKYRPCEICGEADPIIRAKRGSEELAKVFKAGCDRAAELGIKTCMTTGQPPRRTTMQGTGCCVTSRLPPPQTLKDKSELEALHDERDKCLCLMEEKINKLEGRLLGYLRSAPGTVEEPKQPTDGISALEDARSVIGRIGECAHRIDSITSRLVM